MEMTVVIVVIALLTSLSIPAVRTFFSSLATSSGTRSLISASLASARAIAAKEQRYAGIRFQEAYDPNDPLNTSQYIIFIVYEEPRKMGNISNGFRAVEGIKPIKLPDTVGVMDLNLGSTGQVINADGQINDNWEITDTTAFSIIFSPSGKMVIHRVRVRNRDGDYQPLNPNDSMDDIFNSPENIQNHNIGMFIQDDYDYLGLVKESSRSSFIIYDKTQLDKVDANRRWSDYLSQLKAIHINPYTGTIISAD